MKFLGNILWLLFGGILVAVFYYIVGLLMCITFVGIPFGVQLFKFGTYSLWPFGHELINRPGQPGCLSTVMNLIWIVFGWWEIAVIHLVFGLLCCITIVGIPFGMQHFKMIIPAILPFGKEIK
ncbi:MAG: YccF domain-containing protein [Bacteroidales bacterium]|nr:YccF domain-containing protein [Bacteroidales bacterium]MBP5383111.1 YccF domain-containing protein [Bacteroidales bacterium]MBP5521363.1 YccF domain-containing protein [Bacteroidales bacterium]